jgi:hypothetical protein
MTYIPKYFRNLFTQFLLDLNYDFELKINLNLIREFQKGGGIFHEKQKFIDQGGLYEYNIYINDKYNDDPQQVYISIVTIPNEGKECAIILIDKKDKVAILQNLSYYENCAKNGLRKPGAGIKLLKFTLNLILRYKEKYNVNRILLKDNSFLYCPNCSETIKLAQLRMLTHSYPWYMKYGFMPYNVEKKEISKDLIKVLKLNTDIIKTLKVQNIPIMKIINQSITEENLKHVHIDDFQKLIAKYVLVKDFVTALTQEFNKYCCIILHILKYLYQIPGKNLLFDFNGKAFVLEI